MTTSSCSEYLDKVCVPLLGINARDDPLVSSEALDHTVRKASSNPNVILVNTKKGGHIGFGSWCDTLCCDYLEAIAMVKGLISKPALPRARL